MIQCKACPWKVSTVAARDIPGYNPRMHEGLSACTTDRIDGPLRSMACHETKPGRERPCVGWVANQLGPGNNIALRMRAITTGEFADIRLVGEQHESIGAMIAAGVASAKKRRAR